MREGVSLDDGRGCPESAIAGPRRDGAASTERLTKPEDRPRVPLMVEGVRVASDMARPRVAYATPPHRPNRYPSSVIRDVCGLKT
jgi:hypothetical protein